MGPVATALLVWAGCTTSTPPTAMPTDTDCAGCADTDTGVAVPTEDCGNGADDDGDGLLDCEDADCADAAGCFEDCDSPGDEEGDGLADCDDDDCWGVGTCPARVTVTGGRMDHRLVREVWPTSYTPSGYTTSYCICDGYIIRSGHTLDLFDVRGTVRARGGTCAWSFADGTAAHSSTSAAFGSTTSESLSDVVRNSTYVAPGCGFTGLDFLPRQLIADGSAAATVSGSPWYAGTLVSTARTSRSSSTLSYTQSRTWFVDGITASAP